MHSIQNLKQLKAVDGKPLTCLDIKLDKDGKEVYRTDDDGNPLLNEMGQPVVEFEEVAPSVGRWIEIALNRGLPSHKLTMTDITRCQTVLRACFQNDGAIHLKDEDFAWLKTQLFDDERGKVLGSVVTRDNLGRETKQEASGAMAIWALSSLSGYGGTQRAAALYQVIVEEEVDPATETVAGPIEMNRADRRRASGK